MTEQLDRLKAALADRYALERELGQGGMATVYLAEDPRHHRKVALKVLRPDLAATLGPERFLREVTIAANLQHPHILPVYDSGEAGGFLYYVMPYVEGESLRERLAKHGELPLTDAVRILRDVADAMAAAHAKGVVHRDIKPENIMLSGRHALVADFGVAKAVSEATGRQTLTTAGVALGTPTYMAPEQAAADPHTDHRADLYAFGVTAYEMLTGQPPFVGATPQAVLAAHVTEAPVNVTQRRATLPLPLAQLIMRCLEKKPADRPQSAEELLPVLEGLATPSGGMTPTQTVPVTAVSPAVRRQRWPLVAAAVVVVVGLGAAGVAMFGSSGKRAPAGDVREPVVVLPFEVQATDAELANLGHEAADRIAAAVTEAGLGAVIPFRPAGAGPGTPFSPALAEAAIAAMGAATLVTGVVYQRGDSLEIRAQLLRAADLKPLFVLPAERGPVGLARQPLDAVTQRVLGAVGYYLASSSRGWDVTLQRPPSSLEIFRLMDKADALFRQTGGDSATRTILYAVLRQDSTQYGAALLLATSLWNNNGNLRSRVLASDSILAEIEARRGFLTTGEALDLDWRFATRGSPEEEYRAAIAGFEADSLGWAFTALLSCVRAGRLGEALRYYALRDTSTVWGRDWQAWDVQAARAYHGLGRFEEELALARQAKAREPSVYAHWEREARALAALGRVDDLEQVITGSYALEWPLAPGALMIRPAYELYAHGFADAGRSLIERFLAWAETLPEERGQVYTIRNMRRAALRYLGRYDEVVADYAKDTAADPSLPLRALAMRDAIRGGDTTGAAAMVESLRSASTDLLATWATTPEAARSYYGAQILALLGRKDEAVSWLRQALNGGWRLEVDEEFNLNWEPIRDYPPFQELVKVKG
jgi:tetratricopeptide (TPR) repeat protein